MEYVVDKALEKIAKQIMGFDEASLSALFDKYAEVVQKFEPTKKWEEAVIVLGIIQSVRWKNQLFNHRWKSGTVPPEHLGPSRMPEARKDKKSKKQSEVGEGNGGDKRGKVLRFRPREDDEPV